MQGKEFAYQMMVRQPMVFLIPRLQRPFAVGIDYPGVNIAFTADGGCVTHGFGNLFDDHVQCCGGGFSGCNVWLQHSQQRDRLGGGRPGTKILGGERLAADLLQILVYVIRFHVATLALLVDVFEKFLPGNFFSPLHDPCDVRAFDVALP